jgi:hypothetical protein
MREHEKRKLKDCKKGEKNKSVTNKDDCFSGASVVR